MSLSSPTKDPPDPPAPAGRAVGRRPATGRSFLVIVVVASTVSVGVALWTLHSLSNGHRARGTPAAFRL
jgi:hypothetical protein